MPCSCINWRSHRRIFSLNTKGFGINGLAGWEIEYNDRGKQNSKLWSWDITKLTVSRENSHAARTENSWISDWSQWKRTTQRILRAGSYLRTALVLLTYSIDGKVDLQKVWGSPQSHTARQIQRSGNQNPDLLIPRQCFCCFVILSVGFKNIITKPWAVEITSFYF